jgi:hypothetical protein
VFAYSTIERPREVGIGDPLTLWQIERRARRTAMSLFDSLPDSSGLNEFASAIRVAIPSLGRRSATSVADSIVQHFARTPAWSRGPAPGANLFAEIRARPSAVALMRHNSARRLQGNTCQ